MQFSAVAIVVTLHFARVFPNERWIEMSNHVYKVIELTGTSPVSVEEAANAAIARASKTIRNMRWFEVIETRGAIEGGKVSEWQVSLKVGFTLDDK